MADRIMQFLFSNNAASTLSVAAQSTDTTLTLAPGSGIAFPTISFSGQSQGFALVLSSVADVPQEVVYCFNRIGDVLSVSRGQEGTLAQPWPIGTLAQNLVTAGYLAATPQQIQLAPVLFSQLPANPPDGMRATISDGFSATFFTQVISGGGSFEIPVVRLSGKWRVG